MSEITLSLPSEYWKSLQVNKQDLEFLQNHLFETETPLTVRELALVLIDRRIQTEREAALKKRLSGGKIYQPKNRYKGGEKLVFPALDWTLGTVTSVRAGSNPEVGEFEVIEVAFDGKPQQLFASGLEAHKLNENSTDEEGSEISSAEVQAKFGKEIETRLEEELQDDDGLVRIAGRWFPRALLVDVNVGHLNLAEAVLDMSSGEPLPTKDIMDQIELPEGINPKLAEFSLNFALQEDARFDEVGPAGQVLWCLERLEPQEVRETPQFLRYTPVQFNETELPEELQQLEILLDDELSDSGVLEEEPEELEICLTYPHWRAGTLPVSSRLASFFPTAYESPRIRFTFVDGNSSEKIPAWVVRKNRYVYGLREWFDQNELMPGSLIAVRRGDSSEEVILEAQRRRPTREWIRTVLAGTDGGLVFAVLKQMVSCEFNERMVIAVPDVGAIDKAWTQMSKSRLPFEKLVINTMRELSKLTPQGHVHAQELYSALNIIRRCPPAPLFSLVSTSKNFTHVGDQHFRLTETPVEEA